MKGLIYKDFMTLRRMLKVFLGVTIGVIVFAFLILLSFKYGNMNTAMVDVAKTENVSMEYIRGLIEKSIYFMMLLPVCFVGDVTTCAMEDARVGYYKPLSGMPFSAYQIVGARFITTFLYGLLGMGASLLAAGIVSFTMEEFVVMEYLAAIALFGSVMMIYTCFIHFITYFFGTRYVQFISAVVLLCPVVVSIIWGFKSGFFDKSDEEINVILNSMMSRFGDFMKTGYIIMVPIAVVCVVVFYFASVASYKVKRRVM